MKLRVDKCEHSETLPLSRLWLSPAPGDPSPYLGTTGKLEIGLVLKELRCRFRQKYNGWEPPMGKNRAVFDNVIEGGSMSYGGVGDPLPITWVKRRKALKDWSNRPAAPGRGVRVGMVDTVMTSAPPLAGSWYATTADTLAGPARNLRDGHATFVAGMILSEAPGSNIDVSTVLDEEGRADSWSAAHAIVKVGRSGVHILNLSFSCITGDGLPPLALATAVDLLDPDVLVVAAAGNHVKRDSPEKIIIDGRSIDDINSCVAYPAALDNVVAVGCVTNDHGLADYSPNGAWVDILGYGDQVVSTFPNFGKIKGFAKWSGTSFAAGQVSGAIAAQTVPNQIPARQAWKDIQETAAKYPGATLPSVTTASTPRTQVPALASNYPPRVRPGHWWGSR